MRLRKASTPLPSKWGRSSQALIERLPLANIDRTMRIQMLKREEDKPVPVKTGMVPAFPLRVPASQTIGIDHCS
jgi:hypothetical protein